MEKPKAKELLLQIASALQTGAASITAYDDLAVRLKRYLDDTKALEEKIKVLGKGNRNKDLLISAYGDATKIKFEICPSCNGDGGFHFEGGPGEYGYEPCKDCNEKGVLTK